MKQIGITLVFTFFFISCNTSKNVVGNLAVKKLGVNKVVKKHLSANFNKNIIDAKLKVAFKNSKLDESFSVQVKIKKDEEIWLKGTKLITLFKAKITPTKISYYSPYQKNYFEGDFSLLKQLLGVDINFEQLQNMLLGQAMFDVQNEAQNIDIVNDSYVLYPEVQSKVFDIFYTINSIHFKLDKQSVINTYKNVQLDVLYPKYLKKQNNLFPENIVINAKENNNFTTINMLVKSLDFTGEIDDEFTIPSGYKKIQF